ncbi:hypothetical protein M501DRAFT_914218, partial [Patellaria atrata CBS 101060]
SQPNRPHPVARNSSTSSSQSQSPSDAPAPSTSQRQIQFKPQRHVVGGHGHGRLGPRNTSFGKNLNKLNKLTQAQAGEAAAAAARHHRRSLSGNETPTSTTPAQRPALGKRNASAMTISKNMSQTALRKNNSSGHLPRQGAPKGVIKATKSEVTLAKRSHRRAAKSKSRDHSPEPAHPTVHFALGDEEHQEESHENENEWTEDSASQSPATTRDNTRQNSVILDHSRTSSQTNENYLPEQRSSLSRQLENTTSQEASSERPQSTRANTIARINGASSYHSMRQPEADMITSRLLQRSASHNLAPQLSSVSATIVSETHDPREFAHTTSAGSTLADHSGRDLVSRFLNPEDSSGTPKEGSAFLPKRTTPPPPATPDLDAQRRNKSAPDFSATNGQPLSNGDGTSQSRTPSRRSGTVTPAGDLPPSRTQQKMMLERAHSELGQQQSVPAVIPRFGGPQLIGAALISNSEGGRIDPRLLRQFEQARIEYKIVRRFRSPVTEAVGRAIERQGKEKWNSQLNYHMASNSHQELKKPPTPAQDGRRARVSFDVADEDEDEEGGCGEESRRSMSKAEEICRRLWE